MYFILHSIKLSALNKDSVSWFDLSYTDKSFFMHYEWRKMREREMENMHSFMQ